MTDLTIPEFRAKHRLKKWKWAKLKKRGLTPKVICPPGCREGTITPEHEAEWVELMVKLSESEEAQIENERRSERNRRAGKRAAESPNHIWQRRAAAKRAAAAPPPPPKKRGRPRLHAAE